MFVRDWDFDVGERLHFLDLIPNTIEVVGATSEALIPDYSYLHHSCEADFCMQ